MQEMQSGCGGSDEFVWLSIVYIYLGKHVKAKQMLENQEPRAYEKQTRIVRRRRPSFL